MAISFVGAASAAATSLTLPTHQAGDLILLWAYRSGSTTAPTLPSGWIDINSSGNNNNSSRLAYLIATGAGTASGTWTNATHISSAVYRADSGNISIGANATTGNSGNTLTYSALTLQDIVGTSWVVGFAGHRQATNVETAPTGMTNRTSTATTGGESAAHDTNAGVMSWSSQTVSVSPSSGGTQGWRTAVVELIEFDNISLAVTTGAFTLTGIAADSVSGYGITPVSGAFTLTGPDIKKFRNYFLDVLPGNFLLAGQAQLAGPPLLLDVDAGSFALTGNNIFFRRGRITPPWQASRAYVLNDIVRPTIAQGTGLAFRCIVAGTTGTSEPFWPTVINNTVVDGNVTWLAVSLVAGSLQQPNPTAIIELFELELFADIHGVSEIYRFHAGTNLVDNGNIRWQNREYLRFPVEADGFEYNGQGQLPRPRLRVSNAFSTITAILLSLPNGLEAARLSRIRTLAKYLDNENFINGQNPFGDFDNTTEFPREIFIVDRKIAENRLIVEFELVSALDLANVRIPKRQCIANVCQWRYRSTECGYTGTTYFNSADQSVSLESLDVCGKRLTSCRLRFGQNAELPFGSFPGVGRIAG